MSRVLTLGEIMLRLSAAAALKNTIYEMATLYRFNRILDVPVSGTSRFGMS